MYNVEIWHEVGGWHVHNKNVSTLAMAESLLEYQKRFNRTRTRIVRVLDGAVIKEWMP